LEVSEEPLELKDVVKAIDGELTEIMSDRMYGQNGNIGAMYEVDDPSCDRIAVVLKSDYSDKDYWKPGVKGEIIINGREIGNPWLERYEITEDGRLRRYVSDESYDGGEEIGEDDVEGMANLTRIYEAADRIEDDLGVSLANRDQAVRLLKLLRKRGNEIDPKQLDK
jgi:hypothetical protein